MAKNEQAITGTISKPSADSSEINGGYQAVKYNAMTHGILSRHTVLPHEDRNEYDELLSLLTQEHQPQGITEGHLVEELAGIMWRKQRVLQAEGAKLKDGLRAASVSGNLLYTALPFYPGMSRDGFDIPELLRMTPEETTEYCQTAVEELQNISKTEQALDTEKSNYKAALSCLCEEDRDWWEQTIEDNENDPTVDDLLAFVQAHLKPWYERQLVVAEHITEIKSQVYGEAIQPLRIEKLNRYETHLDRKFQRSLGMLIKLKELRHSSHS